MKVAKRENSILIDDNINYLIDLQVAREGLDTYRERQPFQQSLTGVKQTVEVAQHHQSVDPSLIQLNQKLVEAIAEIESYVIPNLERQLQLPKLNNGVSLRSSSYPLFIKFAAFTREAVNPVDAGSATSKTWSVLFCS